MLRVAVCVSGGGTNLQALIDAVKNGTVTDTEIVLVVSNNKDAYALTRARNAGIPERVVTRADYADDAAFEQALLQTLAQADPGLIVLAGFLVKVPPSVITRFPGRIINIHPSLIPAFCGTGFYGLKVHEAVLRRGVKVTGATVHIVDEDMDTGPILLQKAVAVRKDDTPKTLQMRVMEEAEWVLLPQAVQMIAHGEIP